MLSTRLLLVIASATVVALAGCAQPPAAPPGHVAHHPGAASPTAGQSMPKAGPGGTMARMDEHMKGMRGMHDRMMRAKTTDERNALMAEHMKLMQDGMAMMGGMGGMSGMQGSGPGSMAGDPAARQQMLEKRMEMMQSMMQMMMDRMPPAATKP